MAHLPNQVKSGSFLTQAAFFDSKGKWHLKSFSAPTREEAIVRREAWICGNDLPISTVSGLVYQYIQDQKDILSLRTIHTYHVLRRKYLSSGFGKLSVEEVSVDQFQDFAAVVSTVASQQRARTICNLVVSSIQRARPEFDPIIQTSQKE